MKFLDGLEAKITDRQHPLMDSIMNVDVTTEDLDLFGSGRLGTEVDISVRLGPTTIIPNEIINTPNGWEAVRQAKIAVGHKITDFVYGELTSQLLDLRVQLLREGHYDSRAIKMVEDMINELSFGRQK